MVLGSVRGRYWKQVRSRTLKKWHRLMLFGTLLAPLGRFGAPLGPNLAPNGGPRVPKWVPESFKIDANIDAKIDDEEVAKNILGMIKK